MSRFKVNIVGVGSIIVIVVGVISCITDFSRLGSYDIYDPGAWPRFWYRQHAPFLLPLLSIALVVSISIFKNKKLIKILKLSGMKELVFLIILSPIVVIASLYFLGFWVKVLEFMLNIKIALGLL